MGSVHWGTKYTRCTIGHVAPKCSPLDVLINGVCAAGKSLPARKVEVKLAGTNYLSLAEVEVYDASGHNVALESAGATATQSSLWSASDPASDAINGNLDDYTHT